MAIKFTLQGGLIYLTALFFLATLTCDAVLRNANSPMLSGGVVFVVAVILPDLARYSYRPPAYAEPF